MRKRKNKATLSREMLGFYRGEWCSTTGRATRPALIRQSRFSHRSHRENRAWHLLPQKRAGEGMIECRNKPTSRQRREVVRGLQGPGARSDEWKVQEQTHSAHSRKLPKVTKQSQIVRRMLGFGNIDGAPPPVATRDRPSSASHGSRHRSHRENRAGHLLCRKEREKGPDQERRKQTHFAATIDIMSIAAHTSETVGGSLQHNC